MTTFTLRTAYAAGLAAVVLLAGCGDGGVPAGGPSTPVQAGTATAAASSTANPTATTAAPVDPVLARIPAEARPESPEGAEAFAAHYFQALDAASENGDPGIIEGLAQPSCTTCLAFVRSLQSLADERRHHDGTTLKVADSTVLNFTKAERTVLVRLNLYAVPIVDASGKTVDRTEADEGAFIATLSYDDHWWISKLQVAK